MIALLAFALLATANADLDIEQTEDCAVSGAQAVGPAADAAVYIWAATQRCSPNSKIQDAHLSVKCEMDVTATAQSIADMANVIVKASKKCGLLDSSSDCGIAVGQLLSATAGLANAIGNVINNCPNINQPTTGTILNRQTNLGLCIIDVKNALKGVFDIMQGLTNIKQNVAKQAAVAGLFADFGGYVANAVDDCHTYANKGQDSTVQDDCAAGILGLVSSLTDIGEIGNDLSQKCEAARSSRLYSQQKVDSASTSIPINLALLPIVAVASFFAGKRLAKTRSAAAREVELGEDAEE